MLLYIVSILVIVSVVLAIHSLRNLNKLEEVGEVKKELKTGRVIFQNDSSYSSEKE